VALGEEKDQGAARLEEKLVSSEEGRLGYNYECWNASSTNIWDETEVEQRRNLV